MPSLREGGNRPRVPRMKDLNSVEEVIMTAYEYLDVMSWRDLSAVWARIPQLRQKSSKTAIKSIKQGGSLDR